MATQVSTENVEKTIYDGLVELGTERDELSREATLEDLDVDSLDLVELAQIVEDEFGVELNGDDVKDVKTVGEVIDLVVAKAAMTAPGRHHGRRRRHPAGVGSDPLIERWIAGESGIEDGFGRCRDFEPTDFLSKKEARRADRFAQMAIVAGDEAIEQAVRRGRRAALRPLPGRLRDRHRDRRPRLARGAAATS